MTTARVTVLNEVDIANSNGDGYKLCFQHVIYVFKEVGSKKTTTESGYRFIWRREDGSLQAARGQARIPDKKSIDTLTNLATQAGWYK